jgi:hypothetical protein
MKNCNNSITYFLTLPSLIYLSITLLSGIWIRTQWIVPDWAVFNPKFAIHAHSHLALLGWLFPILFRFLLPKTVNFSTSIKWTIFLMHVTIITMFPAFLIQGYAFWSILLSSLFLIISYFLIFQLRKEVQFGSNIVHSAAIGFYLLSTIGPWALGASTKFGTEWLYAWIAFFLHLQFNGWITFSTISLLFKKKSLNKTQELAIIFLFIGTLFITPGLMNDSTTKFMFVIISASSLFLVFGVLMLLFSSGLRNHYNSVKSFFLIFFTLKTIGLILVPFDFTQTWIHELHSFRVAFTHFSLLTWASSIVLFSLFGLKSHWLSFFSFSLFMSLFLIIDALQWYPLLHIPFNIQWIYIVSGILMFFNLLKLIITAFPRKIVHIDYSL